MQEETNKQDIQLEGGTYEIIQNRLQKQKGELQQRLSQLNDARKKVFTIACLGIMFILVFEPR